jgi:hypothetical protein
MVWLFAYQQSNINPKITQNRDENKRLADLPKIAIYGNGDFSLRGLPIIQNLFS